jgi:hypothetical protein
VDVLSPLWVLFRVVVEELSRPLICPYPPPLVVPTALLEEEAGRETMEGYELGG